MTRRLKITPLAQSELDEDAHWWARHRDPEQSIRWLKAFDRAMSLLIERAQALPLARENDNFPIELRQMTFGLGRKVTHRAVFEIRGDEIVVHAIRHLARDDLTPEELVD